MDDLLDSNGAGQVANGISNGTVGESPRLHRNASSAADLDSLLAKNRQWAASKVDGDPTFFSRISNIQTPEWLWIGAHLQRWLMSFGCAVHAVVLSSERRMPSRMLCASLRGGLSAS